MSTADNPISHHTSHTMGNGASSSNNGNNCNGAHSVSHHTSHTMENGASSSSSSGAARAGGEGSFGHGPNIGGLEASLTPAAIDLQTSNISNKPHDPSENDDHDEYHSAEPPALRYSSDSGSTQSTDTGHLDLVTNISTPKVHVSDNFTNFSLIDTTLREGEQFATAHFNTAQKIKIAKALDDFGVEYIELTSPAASAQSRADCEAICKLGLKAKILSHVRCNMDDARMAVETGVDGVNLFIGTSSQLMKHSHGKDMDYIRTKAEEVIGYLKSQNVEIRFSGEDSFRSDFGDIIKLYSFVHKLGARRVGIADTVGAATPREVFEKVARLRNEVGSEVEVHFHNDTGCAHGNAFVALEAGATHIDVTVLGIGERNGITSLSGFLSSLLPTHHKHVLGKYNLEKLSSLESLVAETVGIEIPFNNFTPSL